MEIKYKIEKCSSVDEFCERNMPQCGMELLDWVLDEGFNAFIHINNAIEKGRVSSEASLNDLVREGLRDYLISMWNYRQRAIEENK